MQSDEQDGMTQALQQEEIDVRSLHVKAMDS